MEANNCVTTREFNTNTILLVVVSVVVTVTHLTHHYITTTELSLQLNSHQHQAPAKAKSSATKRHHRHWSLYYLKNHLSYHHHYHIYMDKHQQPPHHPRFCSLTTTANNTLATNGDTIPPTNNNLCDQHYPHHRHPLHLPSPSLSSWTADKRGNITVIHGPSTSSHPDSQEVRNPAQFSTSIVATLHCPTTSPNVCRIEGESESVQ